MSAVDDAIERAEKYPFSEDGTAYDDRIILAAEVKRLQAESVHAPAAMYGKPGREPICDFDCDYCRGDDE